MLKRLKTEVSDRVATYFSESQLPVDKVQVCDGSNATAVFAMISPSNEGRMSAMTIADRIQHLRKAKGISQEELADQIGVSRQAVSKWESEQSTPDIEKIIIMSNYFEVTTDYLLKGIEVAPIQESGRKRSSAVLFAVIGTAFNFMGLVIAAMIWKEDQVASSVGVGLILMAFGCMLYGVGMVIGQPATRASAKKYFLAINVWFLALMPIACIFNWIDGFFGGYVGMIAPYPLMGNSFITYAIAWLIYFSVCIFADLYLWARA
jgi:transcriptional regulator with XRE-family HTH domain